MLIAGGGNIRSASRLGGGLRLQIRSRVRSDDLSGLRLPIGQKIADIDICFQLGLFILGQLAFVRANVELFYPGGIVIGEIKGQDAFRESLIHPMPRKVEHPSENIGVRF
jgi:hypothetical protein